jgi:hypothetical protein
MTLGHENAPPQHQATGDFPTPEEVFYKVQQMDTSAATSTKYSEL